MLAVTQSAAPSLLAETQERGCCSRFTTNWRVIPAMICTVTAIVALFCCFIWNQPYLAILFGVGVISSAYLFYLARVFATYKGLDETLVQYQDNEVKLRFQVGQLGSSNQRMTQHLQDLETRKGLMDRTVAELRLQVSAGTESGQKLHTEVTTLGSHNETLRQRLERFEEDQKDLEATIVSYRQGLSLITSATDQIQSAAGRQEGQSVALREIVTNFEAQMKKMAASRQSGNEQFAGMLETLSGNVESIQRLADLFSIERVRDVAVLSVQQRTDLESARKEAEGLKVTLAHLRAQFEALGREYEQRLKEKTELDEQITKMRSLLTEFGQVRDDMRNQLIERGHHPPRAMSASQPDLGRSGKGLGGGNSVVVREEVAS